MKSDLLADGVNVCLHSVTSGRDRKAIYCVAVASGIAFMSIEAAPSGRDRAVVIVDAGRFLAAWQHANRMRFDQFGGSIDAAGHSPPHCLPFQPISEFHRDYKFASAANHFAEGLANPVPLADVGLADSEGRGIGFTDGITRTLWLYANQAKAFPIMCSVGEAEQIQRAVGVNGATWASVNEMLGQVAGRVA